MNAHIAPEDSRSLRLKAATRDSHGALDKRIMAGDTDSQIDVYERNRWVEMRLVSTRPHHKLVYGLIASIGARTSDVV